MGIPAARERDLLDEPKPEGPWEVRLAPRDKGMVIFLVNKDENVEQPVTKVSYQRPKSAQPDVPFEAALRREIATADGAVDYLNAYPNREDQ